METDKLKSLLITITSELRKLSKEELLYEVECAKDFSSTINRLQTQTNIIEFKR